MNRVPITCGEFYDVPRMIQFSLGDHWYFLRSPFDEEKDDYSDNYDVYLLPFHSEEEISVNQLYWQELTQAASLGQIPIEGIGLDPTHKWIDGDKMAAWLSAHRKDLNATPVRPAGSLSPRR